MAAVAHSDMIVVRGGTVSDHLERRCSFTEILDRLVDVGIRDRCLLLFHFQFLVRLELKSGKISKVALQVSGCASSNSDLRSAVGQPPPTSALHCGLEVARNQGLGNFTANVVLKMTTYQSSWGVTGTKARNPRALGELPATESTSCWTTSTGISMTVLFCRLWLPRRLEGNI